MLTEESFKKEMAMLLKQPVDRLGADVELKNLVAESLMLVETVIGLQEEFGIRLSQEQLGPVKTVGQLWAVFENNAK